MLAKRTQRVVSGAAAAVGFATLYLASQTFAGDFNPVIVSQETVHNAGHVVVYGGLALLLTKGLGRRRIHLAWLISIALATGEELYQTTVPGRVASFQDGMLNIIAITLALALVNLEPAIRATYQMIFSNPDNPRHATPGDALHQQQPDSSNAAIALTETAIGRDII